jgi:hypothetical protein
VAAVGEAEPLEAALDGVHAVGHGVDAGDEIEIFADAQVLVVTELLRHVADVALDLGLLRADVVTEAGAGAGVGREQAAEHPDEGRLAAAVGAEESVDLAAPHLQGYVVHDGLGAEAFGDAGDVDDEFRRHRI